MSTTEFLKSANPGKRLSLLSSLARLKSPVQYFSTAAVFLSADSHHSFLPVGFLPSHTIVVRISLFDYVLLTALFAIKLGQEEEESSLFPFTTLSAAGSKGLHLLP